MTLVFLLEEPSMRELLRGLLPRVLPPGVDFRLIAHEGKSDLERSIPRKLRAWRDPGARFIIVRDQDSGDCQVIKRRLQSLCADAGRPDALVRIVCRELEAWILGDLEAAERALGVSGLSKKQDSRKFRNPDRLGSPSKELAALVPGYGKVTAAKRLGPVLSIDNRRSPSFAAFVSGVRRETRRP